MKAIDADFSKVFLFPPSLEDFVPPDHPARFIREFVEYILPDAGVEWKNENGEGRPPFAAALLFRVWLYGYLHRITTVRKLEAACREHVGLLWLTGMQSPDHNTLWRFWRMNRKTIRRVFRQVIELAVQAGMIGMALHAVDGTKIQARSSTRTAWSRRKLEKFLVRLDQQMAAMETAIASHDGGEDEGYRLREDLANQQALRETIAQRLQTLTSHQTDDMNPNEPEARLMKSGGTTRLGYNAQIVADSQKGMIVAETVVTDAFDQGQLMPMLDLVEEERGRIAAETVADGGYNTEQTLLEADAKDRSITLAAGPADAESHPDEPYHFSRFHYDENKNVFICPQGQELIFEATKNKGGGRKVEIYRCLVSGSCPVARDCTRSSRGRSVERTEHHAIVERHRQKRRSEVGRANLKKRSVIAERPFACVKRHLGFVRFRSGGLLNAAAEWSWICLTFNLKILLVRWQGETAARFARFLRSRLSFQLPISISCLDAEVLTRDRCAFP